MNNKDQHLITVRLLTIQITLPLQIYNTIKQCWMRIVKEDK